MPDMPACRPTSMSIITLLHAEAPVSLAGVQRFVEALLEEHVTPSTVGEIVLRVHGFLCHAETHLQHAAPQTIAALADDHQCVRDALEKLLVSKVYHRVFGVSEGGLERDSALHKRLSGLSHLTRVERPQPAARCCCNPGCIPVAQYTRAITLYIQAGGARSRFAIWRGGG